MTKVPALIAQGTAQLGSAAEARTLLAYAAGLERGRLAMVDDLPAATIEDYRSLLQRRSTGIPVQYLTGRAAFRTVEVAVAPGVFIPRPETEVMTGWAIERLQRITAPVVVELCAGSGAISLAIATETTGVRQYAVELSETAAKTAADNLSGTGVDLRVGDMADAFPELNGQVDLVIANPPYIPLEAWEGVSAEVRAHEPALALFSGADGLDALRVVAAVAARLLRPGAVVCAEHAESQSEAVTALFAGTGWYHSVVDHQDLTDRPRFVSGVRAQSLAG
ncbi:MAG TPA: peptide chain release factor N(5)-glutamine methyltransferase [Propionicimonas sp.]|nr:peptide chain release factor N(5)-glutamine methyltransferase [Propionicimonas sp.]